MPLPPLYIVTLTPASFAAMPLPSMIAADADIFLLFHYDRCYAAAAAADY